MSRFRSCGVPRLLRCIAVVVAAAIMAVLAAQAASAVRSLRRRGANGPQQQRQADQTTAGYVGHQQPAATWAEALDSASEGNETVVVSVVSYSHRLALMNWLVMMQHARGTVSDVVLVCVDSRIAAWMSALGKRCAVVTEIPEGHVRWITAKGVRCADPYRRQTEDSLDECRQACLVDGPTCHAASYDAGSKTCGFCREGASLVSDEAAATVRRQRHALLFQMRMRLLHHYATRGREVVMSDVDALWLRDPLKELRSVGADVVAQRGSHPKLLAKRWGATACMGFVYVKGGPQVVPFLSDAVRLADSVGDDQEGFNTALVHSDVVWQRPKLEYDTSNAVDVGITSESFRVALLPHTKYRRLCAGELDHSTVVAHCYDRGVAKSDLEARQERQRARGVWVLSEQWREMPVVSPFGDYLESLHTRRRGY
eukprot:Rhum_TRINITY_DN15233_c1_g1::Rhum_TRINITY_DN15233_c1_g1_i1::g.145904::m.145904